MGHGLYDRNQAFLIFNRYDSDRDDRIGYGEFCRIIVPFDQDAASKLVGRTPIADRLSSETHEKYKRLLKAHLNLEQAHEYLRTRLNKLMKKENWTFGEIFKIAEANCERGVVGVYNLEKLIIEHRRGGSRNLVSDI